MVDAMGKITINDLAEYTNISKSTISRALRSPDSVSPEKLQIINAAINTLGYIPNYYASNLRAMDNHNIGYIINDVQNPFFSNLIQSIETTLNQASYKLLISFSKPDQNSINEKVKEFMFFPISGLVFSPDITNQEIKQRLLTQLKNQNIYPLQLFAKLYDDFDSIIVNDFHGTFLATERLIHSGHRNILLIGFDNLVFQERIAGYKQAFQDYNIPLNPNNILLLDNREFMRDRIVTKILTAKPTAVISISDIVGINTIKALQQLEMQIPNDISLIHYDDSSWANLLGITTIGHPIEQLGKLTAETLIDGIQNAEKRSIKHQKIDPILFNRNSVKNIYPS
ncbi:MAG: LacI family DNA-binding transcriptional regulator [Lachnospiraceae bacterium]|nr:LacI family DNA-binding transcriptional regulator [Lachnospiraceae bacterium]